ncbi:MAG: TonB-dependent receptor domain-containing protein [Acidobacteriota bacterium]
MSRGRTGWLAPARGTGMALLTLSLVIWASVSVAAARPAGVYQGRPLAEALRRLQDRGLTIFYSSELVHPGMMVRERPLSPWPREILDELLFPFGLQVRHAPGGGLLIVKGPPRGRVVGLVRDAATAHPLDGVTVTLEGTGVVVQTGPDGGFHTVPLPVGAYTIRFSRGGAVVGRLEHVAVTATRSTRVRFDVARPEMASEEITVDGHRSPGREPAPHHYLTRAQIGGEPLLAHDALGGFRRAAGVTSATGSARLSVRGGNDDEVLILLDGLELYDPFHLKDGGGSLSVIDSRIVGLEDYRAGDFPVEYGGRMSGVIDITSVMAGEDGLGSLGLSTTDQRGATQGTFLDGRGSWLASGRLGRPTTLVDQLNLDPAFDPRFYDFFSKARVSLNDTSRLSAHFLTTFDDFQSSEDARVTTTFDRGDFRSRHTSRYGWVTLDKVWGTRSSSRSVLSIGAIDDEREGTRDAQVDVNDVRSTQRFGFKQDWMLHRAGHLFKVGFELEKLSATYDYASNLLAPVVFSGVSPAGPVNRALNLEPSGTSLAVYLDDRLPVGKTVTAELGLRWDGETYTGAGYRTVSPRANLLWELGSGSQLRVAWGYFHQAQRISELQVEDGVSTFGRPQRAEQRSITLSRRLAGDLRIEGALYEKRITDILPRFENLVDPFSFLPETNPTRVRVAPARSSIRGLELSASGPVGESLAWWGHYTLASARDRIDAAWVPRSLDQRHTVQAGFRYRMPAGWAVDVAGGYHTGRPSTPIGLTEVSGLDGASSLEPTFGPRNSVRLPGYRRLDIRISRTLSVRATRIHVYVDLLNALDATNVCCVEGFSVLNPTGESPGIRLRRRPGLSRLVSAGLSWTF